MIRYNDGYPQELERVLPESALKLFAQVRALCGHSVRPLDETPDTKKLPPAEADGS